MWPRNRYSGVGGGRYTGVGGGLYKGVGGGAYTGDLLDLLAELDDDEVGANYEPQARRARHVHRKALAS